jgi:hypothetical protein
MFPMSGILGGDPKITATSGAQYSDLNGPSTGLFGAFPSSRYSGQSAHSSGKKGKKKH